MVRKTLTLVVVSLLLASLGLAQSKSADKKASAAPTNAPDKALMQKILDAWSTMDTNVVGQYYDKASSDVFYDVAPVKYDSWAQYVEGVQKLFGTLQSIKFATNDDATVHHAGNFAWGTSTVKTVMTDKSGKVTNLDCRWTVVWEKKGPHWLVVHDHFSAPMEAAK